METVEIALPFLVHDVGLEYAEPQSHYSIASQSMVTAAVDVLLDHRCFETPLGWVLALDPASLATFLWRPEGRGGERVALPAMDEDLPMNCKCLLSGDPAAAAACVVMVLDLDAFVFWLCRVGGGGKWERHVYSLTVFNAKDQPVERHMANRHGIAALGGKVYYELNGYALGVVEFNPVDAKPKLTSIEVDMVDTSASPAWSSYLVESCGELFLVVVFFQGYNVHEVAEVAVYKMDFSAPAWRKVDAIGDRVFLLGGDSIGESNFGASCSASKHGLAGNCIYFLNHIAISENFLHIINLEEGTGEVLRPFKEFVDPLRPPFWMLPTDP
ncbi:hypothetical protein ACP70R_040896 [Stipagrostis hirtigluma subsp. patula]